MRTAKCCANALPPARQPASHRRLFCEYSMHCSRPPARSGGRSSADRAFASKATTQHALSFAALARHAAPPLRCLALLRRHSDCHGHLFERLRLGLRYVMQRPRRAAARRQRSRSASHSPRASPAGRCRARLRAPWRPQRSGDDWDGDGLSATRPHRVPCAAIGRLGRHSERRAPKKARGHGRAAGQVALIAYPSWVPTCILVNGQVDPEGCNVPIPSQ